MPFTALQAISPLDGRYSEKTHPLNVYFSEYALIYYRLFVEIRWLQSLATNPTIDDIDVMNETATAYLNALLSQFNEIEAEQVKQYEKQTNHDVKAVEYYLTNKLAQHDVLKKYVSFIHFSCTSEDINNLAYALMLKQALAHVIHPRLTSLYEQVKQLANEYANTPMLSRTHGQPATPTTMGKELINFAARLQRPLEQLHNVPIPGKCNGAVGNYNAHVIAYPGVDWELHCRNFVQSLGLEFNPYTTQIEPHDGIAEIAHLLTRINNILLDYSRDIWTYISLGYFKQKTIAAEVGSSTMPHKVNPIDFENAEGNLGLSNALLVHFANKLTQSRLQRDLSDSTVLRNIGTAFAHALLAYQSLTQGNAKLEINDHMLQQALDNHWEVLSEAVQTVMRRYQMPNAYEQLKLLTRGNHFTQADFTQFIQSLPLPGLVKTQLLELTPGKYTGLAATLVRRFS